MSQRHIDIFFKEFPWLREYFDQRRDGFTNIKASRADLKLLGTRVGPGGFLGIFTSKPKKMFLFNQKGQRLLEVRPRESLEEALLRMSGDEQAYYVVVPELTRDTESGNLVASLVIYKPPTDYTLTSWFARMDEAKVHREIEDTDDTRIK